MQTLSSENPRQRLYRREDALHRGVAVTQNQSGAAAVQAVLGERHRSQPLEMGGGGNGSIVLAIR